jgi:putative ABC transport system permease protein
MFSLAVEFLLSQPSVADAGSVVHITLGGASHVNPEVIEFLRTSGVFRDVAGENGGDTFINWNDGHETRRIFCVQATANYFDALGVPVAPGRGWSKNDSPNVAVISHAFWRTRLNGDSSVVGRGIVLDGRPYNILGVLPESHRTLSGFGFSPDVYVPRFLDDTNLAIYARLHTGMSTGEGVAATVALARRVDQAFPQSYKYSENIRVTPVAGVERLYGRKMLTLVLFFTVLLALVGLVLLIASINVASMLLARATVRRQEFAIRLSLGASRGRLLQQLLAESLLLCVLGGALGFLLAHFVVRLLASIELPLPVPIQLQTDPDWRVMTYAALLAGVATIAAGLVPAWQAVRQSLNTNLKREQKLTLRRVLVGGQIAVCLVVLTTGSLFLRNLIRSSAINPGFDVRRTVRADVHLPPAQYQDPQRRNAYHAAALERLSALPGIESAAAARIIPFTDATNFSTDVTFDHTGRKQNVRFHWNAVSPDYFAAMDIPIRGGRAFLPADATGHKVAIVNETFVRRYIPDRDPVGATFFWHDPRERFTIVGVAARTLNITIGEDEAAQLYQPLAQTAGDRTRIQFVLRSATPPATQLQAVKRALRTVEPGAGLEVATMYSSIGMAFLPSQVGAALMGGIGLLGLLLAAIGLYGVIAYSVSQRTREIGIRVAIGAGRGHVSRLVLLDSLKLLASGAAIGLAVALFVTKPLTMFFVAGLSATDPLAYGAVLLLLGFTTAVATVGPMRRAMKIDPARCLRYE